MKNAVLLFNFLACLPVGRALESPCRLDYMGLLDKKLSMRATSVWNPNI